MSTQNNAISRRSFLKGMAYTSALSVGGVSAVALAGKPSSAIDADLTSQAMASKIPDNGDIRIIQETVFNREKVTLINESQKLQMIDARRPVSLYQANGKLVVRVNQDEAKATNGMLVMSPGQNLHFDVAAFGIEINEDMDLPALTNLAENELQIRSKHSIFNRIVPVQVV